MARANKHITAATLADLVRAVGHSDGAVQFKRTSQLAAAARLTVATLAFTTLGRTVHLDLGNGYRLECTVAPTDQPATAGA